MIKLLFVEDDDAYAYAIRGGLELLGSYDVRCAKNGKEALDMYETFCPDVVVSDVEMPEMNGFELAECVRAKDKKVILLLATGLQSPKDLKRGYGIGIDEYVKKPYIADELHLRIQAIVNRTRNSSQPHPHPQESEKGVSIGRYIFDAEERTLTFYHKTPQKLTPFEAEILSILYENQNRLVNRSEFLQRFWEKHLPEYSSRNLDVFIAKLRKYLSHDTSIKIVTERGKGLRLEMG